MKLIIEHDLCDTSKLKAYTSYMIPIGMHYKIIETEEKYFKSIKEIAKCTEAVFYLSLCKNEHKFDKILCSDKSIILAYIGSKKEHIQADGYYNMTKHIFKKMPKVSGSSGINHIHCYSNNDRIDNADYIRCIYFLRELSEKVSKPILILSNAERVNNTYGDSSLTNQVIHEILEDNPILLVAKISKENLNYYYTILSKEKIWKGKHILYVTEELTEAYSIPRAENTLYNDVFYQSISPDQYLYVLLGSGDIKTPDYYETLGLKAIIVMNGYSMLYAKKSQFDAVSSLLKSDVVPQYEMPILSHTVYGKKDSTAKSAYRLVKEDLKYKGKGVYIGLVTADDVDYTCKALRYKDGTSRIAYIWHQIEADQGEIISKEQINEVLIGSQPKESISLPKEGSVSTMMLSIAAGKDQEAGYFGIADEAEFIVAKINTAPSELQRIYGGMPAENGVLIPDIIIGVTKLVDFAAKQQVPLVLCVPFNGNIDSHDGTQILQEILGLIARRTHLTIVVPAGDEADKMHHYGMEGKQGNTDSISLNVTKKNQNIIGIIYQRFSTFFEVNLYPPASVASTPINMMQQGITYLNEAIVYSNGIQISFLNGAGMLMFRIENPQIGAWRIEGRMQTETESQIDLWISQQELNDSVTLRPSNAATTLGSLAAVSNIMSVGGYNKEGMVVLKDSGRGYSWDNRIAPLFVTQANQIVVPCGENKWVSITGTLPAAAVMMGTVAVIYSKFIEENVSPFPNTLVVNNLILSQVKQFEEITYPNASQGYGIFDIQKLGMFL